MICIYKWLACRDDELGGIQHAKCVLLILLDKCALSRVRGGAESGGARSALPFGAHTRLSIPGGALYFHIHSGRSMTVYQV
jgi:hypothetical protein